MAVQISGNDITVPRDGSFTRNVTIGGTLTYEDVTNIDSVGLVTARNGIEIGARPGVAASISVDGNMIISGISTFGGDVQVPDKIIHSGDTNTAIRFPAADTITAETAGSERIRIKSDGSLQVPIGSNIEIGQIASSSHADGNTGSVLLGIEDGGGAMSGVKVTNVDAGTYNDQIVTFLTAQGGVSTPTERLRITSGGKIGIGINNPTGMLAVSDGTVIGEINPYQSVSACYIGTRSNHGVILKCNAQEKIKIETNRKQAIYQTLIELKDSPESVLLIAGKGHESYQEIKGKQYEFNDKDMIRSVMSTI